MLKTLRPHALALAAMALLLCTAAPQPAGADTGRHRAAVFELLELVRVDALTRESVRAALQQQYNALPALKNYSDIVEPFFEEHLSYEALKEEYADLYVEAFSEAEIRELIAFYETPLGQKTLNVLPELMQRGTEIGARRLRENMDELMEKIQARQTELLEEALPPGTRVPGQVVPGPSAPAPAPAPAPEQPAPASEEPASAAPNEAAAPTQEAGAAEENHEESAP